MIEGRPRPFAKREFDLDPEGHPPDRATPVKEGRSPDDLFGMASASRLAAPARRRPRLVPARDGDRGAHSDSLRKV